VRAHPTARGSTFTYRLCFVINVTHLTARRSARG